MNPDLNAFLEHARAKGMDHQTVRMLLLAAGWKEKDVAKALAEHALELPVPVPPDAGGARDAFLHLSAFAALYASAIASISLLFDYINRWLPDPALPEYQRTVAFELQHVRWSLATLLVAFPAYVLLSRFLLREMKAEHEKSWSGVRRWLTYLTLFVAGATLACDLVTLLYYFLEGELSLRFLLKVGVVTVVALLAFVYYLATVRMPARVLAASRMHRRFAATATAIAGITAVWGAIVVGAPGTARLLKLDTRRVDDLTAIEDAIAEHCTGHARWDRSEPRTMQHPLPADLESLAAAPVSQRPRIKDPATGATYDYRATGDSSYELCATFDRARDEDQRPGWNHPAGHHCFTLDAVKPD